MPSNKYENIINTFKDIFINKYLTMNDEKKSSDLIVGELIKKIIRQIIREDSSKKPEVNTHIIRI